MKFFRNYQRVPRLIGLLTTVVLTVCTFAANTRSQNYGFDRAAFTRVESGQTVILGTWNWGIEKNTQGRSATNDVWWQQVDDVSQFLVPQCKARLAIIAASDYESVGPDDVFNAEFSIKRIANTRLLPGTVLAMRTTEGNFAKMKIVGYRDLHDFSYPDSVFAHESWKEFVWSKPNRPNYHLEIEWTLYRRP